MSRGRAYHPQSQGRIERQNRTLKSKIRYDEQKHGRSGYNWVVNLAKIVSAINNQPKEVLGYQTPFVIYYARGKSSADNIRKKAAKASKRCLKRAYSPHLKKNSCSIYDKGDKILLRYPFGRRVPYKRYILKGKILARVKGYDMYKIVFKTPQNSILKQWTTSRTLCEEKRQRENAIKTFERHKQRRRHVQKYYITMDHPTCQQDRTDDSLESDESWNELDESYFCNNDKIRIDLDPRGYGSCQFIAISRQLQRTGIYKTAEELRTIAVAHIKKNHTKHTMRLLLTNQLKKKKKNNTHTKHTMRVLLTNQLKPM